MYFTSGSTESIDGLLSEFMHPCDQNQTLGKVQKTTASKLPSTNSIMMLSKSLNRSNHEVLHLKTLT